jgi:hypothetical protein
VNIFTDTRAKSNFHLMSRIQNGRRGLIQIGPRVCCTSPLAYAIYVMSLVRNYVELCIPLVHHSLGPKNKQIFTSSQRMLDKEILHLIVLLFYCPISLYGSGSKSASQKLSLTFRHLTSRSIHTTPSQASNKSSSLRILCCTTTQATTDKFKPVLRPQRMKGTQK